MVSRRRPAAELDLRALASALVEEPAVLVLLAQAGESAQVILACSRGLSFDVRPVLQTLLSQLENGRGGGRPDFAQGSAAAGMELLDKLLGEAQQQLLSP